MDAQAVVSALTERADPSRAEHAARFFKTGPGQYGEGDIWLGLPVPETREEAKRFRDLPLADIDELLESPLHEVRLAGVVILTTQFDRSRDSARLSELIAYYVGQVQAGNINNWDLIDVSAPHLGAHLLDDPRPLEFLMPLAAAESMWERRLAVLLTFAFIRAGRFEECLTVSTSLLGDKQDLMHKAVGWMLREVGKRDADLLRAYLGQHIRQMPRTALRYAIEKFDEPERKEWLRR